MSRNISVIIPYYCGEEYIEKTINSVKKLNGLKEVIIVNDGSDSQYFNEMLCKYKNDEVIKCFTKENGGVASAREYGVHIATGDYLLFVDQDDIIIDNVIDTALDLIEKENADVIFWSSAYLFNDGKTLECDTVNRNTIIRDSIELQGLIKKMAMYEEEDYISYLGHIWCGLYKRKIVEDRQIHFKSFINYDDDFLFVFDYLIAAKCIGFICDVGYYWRVNEQSLSHITKYVPQLVEKELTFFDYLYNEMITNCKLSIVQQDVKSTIAQKVILDGLHNVCIGISATIEERKTLSNYIKKSYKEKKLPRENIYSSGKSDQVAWFFVRMHMPFIAYQVLRIYYRLKRLVV